MLCQGSLGPSDVLNSKPFYFGICYDNKMAFNFRIFPVLMSGFGGEFLGIFVGYQV